MSDGLLIRGETYAAIAVSTMTEIEREGYRAGMREAISRMQMLCAVIPASVTKARCFEMVKTECKALERKGEG